VSLLVVVLVLVLLLVMMLTCRPYLGMDGRRCDTWPLAVL
jgi:hypothetical protein